MCVSANLERILAAAVWSSGLIAIAVVPSRTFERSSRPDLNYDKVENGNTMIDGMDEYHSHNTRRLNIEEMKELLLKVNYVRRELGLEQL